MDIKINTESIFVIHSELDNHIIKKLEDHFKTQLFFDAKNDICTKISVEYLDSKNGNYVGEDFAKLIRKKFRDCYYFLIILSDNSKDSIWVNQEIGYAQATSIKRCIIMLESNLRGGSFGFIHSNYDVQPFSSDNFIISKDGREIRKINNKIIENFGEKLQDYLKKIRRPNIVKGFEDLKWKLDSMSDYVKTEGEVNE